MTNKPYLNLGCGRIILPAPPPPHHALVDPTIYSYMNWLNVDRNPEPGVDKVMDLFTYAWDLEDNAYGGALLSHIVEHIPHEVKVHEPNWELIRHHEPQLFMRSFADWRSCLQEWQTKYQNGWYAFWGELYRVLENGAIVHVLSPYGWSDGGITDPTHTRYLTNRTFTHSMQPDLKSPFAYKTNGINFELVSVQYNISQRSAYLAPQPDTNPVIAQENIVMLNRAMQMELNVAYELYVQLRVIK